jgi:hypothetical protein
MRSDVVETRGLTKRYGNGLMAVDRLDLQVRGGARLSWSAALGISARSL